MEDITEVCRLCLEKKTLVWIFDTRIHVDDMRNIIYVTTGVEISSDDQVSQKVCSKCLQVSAKMYEFRLASQKSDFTLKEKHRLYVEKNTSSKSLNANTTDEKRPLPANNESSSAPEINKEKRPALVHPSIKEISGKYLNIMIPRKCLKLNMLPVVSMAMNEVESYFEKQNIDFQKLARQVLRSVKRGVDNDADSVQGSDCSSKINSSEITESHPPKLDVVMPIKIATNKTGYAIVSKGQTIVNTEDRTDKCIDEVNSSKRKLSETETESATISKKLIKNDTSTLQIGKSVPLYICDICNSVQYSLNVLNKHKLKHLICQFCKIRFKSIERKQHHLEKECTVKNVTSSCLVPSQVKLEKIELNRSIREKYPNAFASFPPFPGMKSMTDSNIIEIIDDDESESLSVDNTNQKKVFQKPIQVEEAYKMNANGSKLNRTEISKSKVNSFPGSSLNIHASSSSRNNDINPPATQEIITSVSVVKPDIRIKNNSILDYMDPKASDIKLMRDFLTKYKSLNASLDQSTQTDLLVNSSIVVNQNEVTTEFKGLKNLLHFFKIPVVIKNGQFSVSYTCDNVEEKKKNMCLWNNLEPVDIAEPKKMSIPKEVPVDQSIAQNASNTTLSSLNNTPLETVSVTVPVTVPTLINYQHAGNVASATQTGDRLSEKAGTSVTIQSSASVQLSPHETAGQGNIVNPSVAQIPNMAARNPNSCQQSKNLLSSSVSRTSSVDVLQSTSRSTVGSLQSNTHLTVIPANPANIPVTVGSMNKTVSSAIPKIGQLVSQPVNTFQTKVNTQQGVTCVLLPNDNSRLTQASGSSVHLPVQLPQRDLQPTINQVVNLPSLIPINSAKESTLQVSSGNMNVGETRLPAPGSIRVKSLIDLT